MSTASAAPRWLSGKLPSLLAATGLLALSITATATALSLNTRLVAAKLQAQRSAERAVRAEATLSRLEKDLAEQQSEVHELTARLKEAKRESELALLRKQVRDSELQDGAYVDTRRKGDAKRAKLFDRCRASDNPLCGIDP